jgi:hypothetical protein
MSAFPTFDLAAVQAWLALSPGDRAKFGNRWIRRTLAAQAFKFGLPL